MKFQAQRGTEDVLPGESHKWLRLEATFRDLARRHGYRELRTPTFEATELFVRSSGEASDIVSKQMYSFTDKGGRDITLKPEGTAPAIRAAIEHGLCPPGSVARLSYVTPMFRYERPQKGRLRESHQVGLEVLGSASPAADAEIIELTVRFFEALGLSGIEVQLNSLGRDLCRSAYRKAILEFAGPLIESFDPEDREKAMKNPLRLLDSKDEALTELMKGAPPIQGFWEEESAARHEELKVLLSEAGVCYQTNPALVRGLDYYTETVFEILSSDIGAQSALCGGGRYDGLVEELGGSPSPAVGVGIGIERALLALEAQEVEWQAPTPDVVVVYSSEAATTARKRARELRNAGYEAVCDLDAKSFRSQLKSADKSGARFALILGEDEVAGGFETLRDMATSEQVRSTPEETLRRLEKGVKGEWVRR